jgi:thioredoxin-related protein
MKSFTLAITLLISLSSFGQIEEWTDISHVEDSLRHHPKMVFIFIYTDWCKVCEMEKNNLFSKDDLNEIKDNFYWVKINGETQEDIKFRGVNYRFVPTGSDQGYHEFVSQLFQGNRAPSAYPGNIVLDNRLQRLYFKNGLLDSQELIEVTKKFK